MRISDSVKGAIVGGIFVIIVAVGQYYFYQKPELEHEQEVTITERQKAVDAEAARKRAEDKNAVDQMKINDLKRKYALIKGQFISRVTDAVGTAGGKFPKGEPNRPPPPISNDVLIKVIIPAAQTIIDERDKARSGILQVRSQVDGNFDALYDALNSDIDALRDAIRASPRNPETIRSLIQKINDKWPTTLTLFQEKISNSLQQMGCPTSELASLP
jgi:hypothetical protein